MSRHSSAPVAGASEPAEAETTSPTTAAIVIEGVTAATERPLSRRELRERERRQQARPVEIADTVEYVERSIAAPPAEDAHHEDIERLLSGVPTNTTEVPLPSRAALRSARRAATDAPSPASEAAPVSNASAAEALVSEAPAPGLVPAPERMPVARRTPAASVSLPATAPLPIIATPVVTLSEPAPSREAAASLGADADAGLAATAPHEDDAPADTRPIAFRRGTRTRTPRRASARRGSGRSRWMPTRRGAAKGATIVTMTVVALMAVSTSVPAEALLSFKDVQAAAVAARQSGVQEPSQTLNLASGPDTISVQRDGYASQTVAQIAAASGIRLEADFTNDPNGTIQWPFAVGVHIGDHFGYRNCAGCSVNHQGQDFNPGLGAPIQAIADGVVSYTEDGEGSLGVHMVIDHHIDGELVSSVYAHMEHGSMQFKKGDTVKVGDVIGYTGNTGQSTGPHLHFEIRIGGINGTHVDPLKWLYAHVN